MSLADAAERKTDTVRRRRSDAKGAGFTPQQHDYEALARFRYEIRRFLAISEKMLAESGVLPRHYQAMIAIRAQPDRKFSIGELARELHITVHAAVELVGRMETAGLVTRSPSPLDRRKVLVELTDEGSRKLPALAARHLAELHSRAPHLSAAIELFQAAAGPRIKRGNGGADGLPRAASGKADRGRAG